MQHQPALAFFRTRLLKSLRFLLQWFYSVRPSTHSSQIVYLQFAKLVSLVEYNLILDELLESLAAPDLIYLTHFAV